jgi:hypothetical protein
MPGKNTPSPFDLLNVAISASRAECKPARDAHRLPEIRPEVDEL